LRLAYTQDELDWLKYTYSIGQALGHPMEIVTPERIRELHPFYNLDGVIGALHTPEDGHVDPSGATFAFAKGAYARQIGQWSGLDLPITNMTHHYVVTDTVPEFENLEKDLPVVRDDRLVSGYIRMEQKLTQIQFGMISHLGKKKIDSLHLIMTALRLG